MRPMSRIAAVAFAVALLATGACACKGGNGSEGTGPGKPGGPGAVKGCDELRGSIEALYRKEPAPPPAAGEDPAKAAALAPEILSDNVDMVLGDCRRQPDRSIACIKAAQSVTQLEHDCLIPLDEEGSEGTAFTGK
jgi:hypothetical protein